MLIVDGDDLGGEVEEGGAGVGDAGDGGGGEGGADAGTGRGECPVAWGGVHGGGGDRGGVFGGVDVVEVVGAGWWELGLPNTS